VEKRKRTLWWKAIDSKGVTIDLCIAENKKIAEYAFKRASKKFVDKYVDWKDTVILYED